MTEMYKSIGFKTPDFIENQYGIKIYIGTKGKDDWCVEVPIALVKLKCPNYPFTYGYRGYLITEEEVLRIAREFTALADRNNKEQNNEQT